MRQNELQLMQLLRVTRPPLLPMHVYGLIQSKNFWVRGLIVHGGVAVLMPIGANGVFLVPSAL